MIAKLSGTVDTQSEGSLILDVNGVGYKVLCSNKTLSQIPSKGEACQLHIEMVVREDSLTLYGFKTPLEQSWFVLLTSVQGVGARVALSILSICEIKDLSAAIASQDKTFITRAEGVGPKLATRIVTELKGKEIGFGLSSSVVSSLKGVSSPSNATAEDAISALTNLGYRPMEASQAIQKVVTEQDSEPLPLEILIKKGLKILSS